jgi:mono/diheme cytochrome c family protein
MRRATSPRGRRDLARIGAVLVAVVGLGCIPAVGHGRAEAVVGNDVIAAGRTAYRSRCASCHGREAHGDGPVGAALRVPPPDLTWLAERHGGTFPRAYVVDVVTGRAPVVAHGTSEMPVWSDRLDGADGPGATTAAALEVRRVVQAIAAYLESIQQRFSARAPRARQSGR